MLSPDLTERNRISLVIFHRSKVNHVPDDFDKLNKWKKNTEDELKCCKFITLKNKSWQTEHGGGPQQLNIIFIVRSLQPYVCDQAEVLWRWHNIGLRWSWGPIFCHLHKYEAWSQIYGNWLLIINTII